MNINTFPNVPSGGLATNRLNSPFQAGNRALGAGRNLQQFKMANHDAVELNISEHAQKLFALMQKENGGLMRLPEFVEKENASLAPMTYQEHNAALWQAHSDNARAFLTRASIVAASQPTEFWSLDNAEMAEMGFQLLSVINFEGDDIHNFVALGNKYAQLRESLEARYSGEELEAQLNKLSEAFDLTTQILARDREITAWFRLHIEHLRIDIHNQMLNQNTTQRFFDGGRIEYDQEKINNIFSMVTNGIRESIKHFAQLTRQFVLENGIITTEQGNENLLALLRSAAPPPGGFSFDDFNNINDILSRPFESSDTPRPHVQRPETMFTELGRIFS